MTFVPGQPVVWSYRPQTKPHHPISVDAEVVQVSQLRIRIRIHTITGTTVFRWVKPTNLRSKQPDEPAYPYLER
jgi:hypothetical protein